MTASVLGKWVRFVILCACIQIFGLLNKLRKIDVGIYFTCKYRLLRMCPCASGAQTHLDSAASPCLVLLGDPGIAIKALSQRIALLCILAFRYRIMILSGICVNIKMSKDNRCLLTVDAACTAAALCLRLASGSEQHFPLILALKAGFGWHTSSEHRLVSPWPRVPSEK